jgi:hypothetical protein
VLHGLVAVRHDLARRFVGFCRAARVQRHWHTGQSHLHPRSCGLCDWRRGDLVRPILVAYGHRRVGCAFSGPLRSLVEWTIAAPGQPGRCRPTSRFRYPGGRSRVPVAPIRLLTQDLPLLRRVTKSSREPRQDRGDFVPGRPPGCCAMHADRAGFGVMGAERGDKAYDSVESRAPLGSERLGDEGSRAARAVRCFEHRRALPSGLYSAFPFTGRLNLQDATGKSVG